MCRSSMAVNPLTGAAGYGEDGDGMRQVGLSVMLLLDLEVDLGAGRVG